MVVDQTSINKTIALACGWSINPKKPWEWTPPKGWLYSDSRYAKSWLNNRESEILYPPDYYNSLDAIQEAIEILWDNEDFWYGYVTELEKLCGQDLALRARILLHATSAQRAEAIVKALEYEKTNKN